MPLYINAKYLLIIDKNPRIVDWIFSSLVQNNLINRSVSLINEFYFMLCISKRAN